MERRPMIIAIDGPAGSGKSTVSKRLAEKLGYTYLDTGAMYRAVTYGAIQKGLDLEDAQGVAAFARDAVIDLTTDHGRLKVFLNGEDVTEKIRTPEVTRQVKYVARNPSVRRRMVALQQELGSSRNIVAEGRDTTTMVFPKASLKVYLDASAKERAQRRLAEFQKKGILTSLEEVLADLQERDRSDFEREEGPLRRAPGAVVIDTTGMDVEAVVAKLFTHLQSPRATRCF